MHAHAFPLLVGDVGATKTVLAVVLASPHGIAMDRQTVTRVVSTAFPHLRDLVASYLTTQRGPRPRAACFGVPGPVLAGSCVTTNLPWKLQGQELAASLGLEQVLLINDVAALAWAFAHPPLPAHRLLHPGNPRESASKLVVAVGTGLGAAAVVETPRGPAVVPTEAGHGDFCPKAPEDWELASWLRKQVGNVTYEHVVSGPGLVRLYRFFSGQSLASDLAAAHDPGAWVVAHAHDNPHCARAVGLAVTYLARFLADLSLVTLPLAGVFLAGSVTAGLVPWLRWPEFARAFQDKGVHQELLAQIPVSLVEDPLAPLLGCAYAWLAGQESLTAGTR